MKTKQIVCSILAFGLLAGCASDKGATRDQQAKLQAKAKISRAAAESTALSRVPGGSIKQAELEQEKGKLIWSFDVAVPTTADITEVNVDALTGEVLSVEKETPTEQEKERQAEAREKKHEASEER
jgi:hypothetical protein